MARAPAASMAPITVSGVRAIVREDLASIKAVIDANDLFPSTLLDDMTASYLGGSDVRSLWLTIDAQAVAYCAPEAMASRTWNVLLIAVHPAFHRRGWGSQLLHFIERALTERGERLLLVETSSLPRYDGARRFYHQRGFEEEARIREFYEANEDKIVFWKRLDDRAATD
jgi:ribosomal protein S18 acetylase RimI-like enzyme